MKHCYIDIETNLAHDHIWCVATIVDGVETLHFDVSTLPEPDEYVYVAHYGLGFDFPVLERLWGWDVPFERRCDTVLLSKLHDANRKGGHSLRNLAEQAGQELKDDFDVEDFDKGYTDKMGAYCMQDVRALQCVHEKLVGHLEKMGFDFRCVDMEHKVRALTNTQTANGFMLDVDKATDMYTDTVSRQREIEAELQEMFPPITHERWSDKTGKRLKDRVEVFNIGSRQQIAHRLESQGVRWSKTTEKGATIVSEETLKPLVDKHPAAGLCLEYLTLGKKASMLNAWLKHVDTDTNRVHGMVDTLGAITGRMTHQRPNLAQVDKDPEMRGCWIVPEGSKLVGVDASGLELRMLAHYMNDDEYIQEILNGDIHWHNALAFGLSDDAVFDHANPKHGAARNTAKTLIYALLYGAGDEKLGSIVSGSRSTGRRMRSAFAASLPAYASLVGRVQTAAKRGYIVGLDGRKLRIRSEHAALNSLLQGAGAIVMKQALIEGCRMLDEAGVQYKVVAQVHDEVQLETPKRYADYVATTFKQAITAAGEQLGMRIPLAGDSHVGINWSETH